MLSRTIKYIVILVLAVGVLLPAAFAVAKDKPACEKKDTSRQLVFGGGDSGTLTIATEGSELIITEDDGDDTRVTVVDIDQVGQMVGDSLEGLIEMVGDMQLQMRLGNDNNFTMAFDDEEVEVDFNAIFSELGQVLDGAFDGMDTSDWSSHRHHRTIDVRGDDASREIEDLRQELKELKAELRRLKNLRDQG